MRIALCPAGLPGTLPGADLLVLPAERAGLHPPGFARAAWPAGLAAEAAGIEALAARTGGGGPGILTGTAWAEGNALRQGVVLLGEGRVLTRRARHLFHPAEPGAGVFTPGPAPGPMVFRSCRLGVMSGAEATDPAIAETLAETGAELLLHLSGAPYLREAEDAAVDAAVPRVVETGLPMLGVSPLGAWGARIWAGGAFALGADRRLLARLPRFAGTPLVTEWEEAGDGWASPPLPLPPPAAPLEELWQALVLALRAALRESRRPRAEAAPDQPLLAALAAAAGAKAGEGPALRLTPLDRTALALGEAAPPGDHAPFRDLFRAELAELAAHRGLPPPLPPNPALEASLAALLTRHAAPVDAAASGGYDPAEAARLWQRVAAASYTRRLAPPGPCLSRRPCGPDPFSDGMTSPFP